MTTIKLKGLDARFAGVAKEVGNIEAILKASSPSHPALQHTWKVAFAVQEIAKECQSILGEAIEVDRRAAAVLSGGMGNMILRHYLTGQSLLGLANRFVPEDAPNGLKHRIDTLLWLGENAKEETQIDSLLLVDVATERKRQIKKHGIQHDIGREMLASVLMEEVGEVFHAINEGQTDEMRKELIEVAACALKWAAEIEWDRRREEEDKGYEMQKLPKSPGVRNPYNPAELMNDMA